MPSLNGPTHKSIPGDSLVYNARNHLVVSVDLSSATWKSVASHEVFTVTGTVRMRFLILCTETLTDAADLATIQFGVEGATNAFIAATGAAGNGGTTISTGEMWIDATPTETYADTSSAILDKIVTGGLHVGYEIAGEAMVDGTLDFHCWWEPLDATGSVVAGAGGSL